MTPDEVQRRITEDIARMYALPGHLLGLPRARPLSRRWWRELTYRWR